MKKMRPSSKAPPIYRLEKKAAERMKREQGRSASGTQEELQPRRK
eukprot:CAMPEP_0171515224 /NCGR_PEP_ID=MMETSP0959-20130129/3324_1 /TAXON_ID=87120 /ORGANISM="Aurantiochytrium limacinum, Strain ATCCMYA-1381" /LENGTH=44 /DNA_ID= /DNA_START= /DNA_END= /DNA_ORIENTATION=